jgi:hypothetical protein
MESKQFQMLQITWVAKGENKVNINMYVSRLNGESKRAHGYCLVMQPIIIMKS